MVKNIGIGGYFGVDLFVVISGFYLIKDEYFGIKWNKILRLWGQIIFYSLSLFVFSCLIGINIRGIKSLIKAILPLTFEQWWFASTYFVMFLLHPFINKLLRSFDKKQYQYFLIVIIFLWIVIPTLTTSNFQSNALIEFMIYYSIAGYIRLYGLSKVYSCKKWFCLWLIFTFMTYGSCIVFMIIGTKYSVFSAHATFFYSRDSILTIIRVVCFFMGFKTLNIKNSRLLNRMATTTFGVYLLHDSDVFRILLWKDIFKNVTFQDTILIIPYSIFTILVVYSVCCIIDLLRQETVEKVYMKFIKEICPKILGLCSKVKEIMISSIF